MNGKKVQEHAGGYDRFTIDVTDAVKDGKNDLLVTLMGLSRKSH